MDFLRKCMPVWTVARILRGAAGPFDFHDFCKKQNLSDPKWLHEGELMDELEKYFPLPKFVCLDKRWVDDLLKSELEDYDVVTHAVELCRLEVVVCEPTDPTYTARGNMTGCTSFAHCGCAARASTGFGP